jgi:hypothetical protein
VSCRQDHESARLRLTKVLFHFTGQKGIDLESLDETHFIPEAACNKDQGSYDRHAGRGSSESHGPKDPLFYR